MTTRISPAARSAAHATRHSTSGSRASAASCATKRTRPSRPTGSTLQQAQVARRLETLERPARVIAFPKAARAVISGHSHVRRWVTVAAAASLIAGFGLGQIVPLRSMLQQPSVGSSQPQLTAPQAAARAVELTPSVAPTHNDDDLLTDAFSRSRVSTLNALDEMTPRARDIEK